MKTITEYINESVNGEKSVKKNKLVDPKIKNLILTGKMTKKMAEDIRDQYEISSRKWSALERACGGDVGAFDELTFQFDDDEIIDILKNGSFGGEVEDCLTILGVDDWYFALLYIENND